MVGLMVALPKVIQTNEEDGSQCVNLCDVKQTFLIQIKELDEGICTVNSGALIPRRHQVVAPAVFHPHCSTLGVTLPLQYVVSQSLRQEYWPNGG